MTTYTPERSCIYKVAYVSRGQAKHAKRVMHRKTKAVFKVYTCPFCGFKHIAHRRTT